MHLILLTQVYEYNIGMKFNLAIQCTGEEMEGISNHRLKNQYPGNLFLTCRKFNVGIHLSISQFTCVQLLLLSCKTKHAKVNGEMPAALLAEGAIPMLHIPSALTQRFEWTNNVNNVHEYGKDRDNFSITCILPVHVKYSLYLCIFNQALRLQNNRKLMPTLNRQFSVVNLAFVNDTQFENKYPMHVFR